MAKTDLKQATLEQTIKFFEGLGEKPFRAGQVRKWIFAKQVADFGLMSDLSKPLRARLDEIAKVTELEEVTSLQSTDGTVKRLFKLSDGLTLESVLIPDGSRRTLCVSSQVGCKLNCDFCLTGKGGFIRDLTPVEIIDQVVQAVKLAPDNRVTNVVLMGMGEPLDNFDNVTQALRVLAEPDIKLIGLRKITLSTAGIVPGILRLADDFPKVKLAVSVSSGDEKIRDRLMPINKKYPLTKLRTALAKFPLPKGRRITIEYVMLSGVNDSSKAALELSDFAKGFPSKINLIPFNECPGIDYAAPAMESVEKFQQTLIKLGHSVFIRQSRGGDIMAACGQLWDKESSGAVL